MIANENFSLNYIKQISKKYKIDHQMMQKSIHALKLVEHLANSGADFIFKGGTSLMLLTKNPKRLSTDVDILVKPGFDIESYIKEIQEKYPFQFYEEDIRQTDSKIVKRHFKLYYDPNDYSEEACEILLDVLYEENHYSSVIQKEVTTKFIKQDGNPAAIVKIPSPNSIIGDKLTAFAPNTTGVQYTFINKKGEPVDKKTEVAKQFYDVACLYDCIDDFAQVHDTYNAIAKNEIEYRQIKDGTPEICLIDTIKCCLAYLLNKPELTNNYSFLLEGLERLKNFIYGKKPDSKELILMFSKVLLLSSCILTNTDLFKLNMKNYSLSEKFSEFKKLEIINEEAYNNLIIASNLLEPFLEKII